MEEKMEVKEEVKHFVLDNSPHSGLDPESVLSSLTPMSVAN